MKQMAAILSLLIVMPPINVSLAAFAQGDEKGKANANLVASVEQIINKMEEDGRQATLKNDVEATERLLADDWMNTNANGTVTTKPQLIALLKSTPFNFISIEDDDVKIRAYEGAAVVTGRSVRKRPGQDGKVIAQQFRFTRVYAKRDGRWQVVAAQSTPILQP